MTDNIIKMILNQMKKMNNKNVHTEHCCSRHGCKYRDENCPVELGIQKQSFDCEDCQSDLTDAQGITEYYFSLLTDDERMKIMNHYCKYCGYNDSNCLCRISDYWELT